MTSNVIQATTLDATPPGQASSWAMIGPRSPRSAGGVVLAIGVLLLVPLVALVVTALVTFEADVLAHLARTVLLETIEVTALLAAGTLAGSVALGVACAWCIERYDFPWRRTLAWMLVLPLAMPTYVIAYAYTDLLQYSGPVQRWMRVSLGFEGRLPDIRSIAGAVVLFSFVLYPYVYLITRTAIAEVSGSAVESARLLGQSRWKVFFRVVRPLIMPSIVAGAMLVLMETLADVGATYYFGLTTFSAGIYKAWFALGSRSAALVLAVVLLAAVAVVHLVERHARGRAMQVTSRTPRPWPPERVPGWRGWLLGAGLSIPVLAGFAIPTGGLLWLLAREPEMTPTLDRFWAWAANSFIAGLFGATLTLAVAIGFVYAARFGERLQGRLVTATATGLRFGYAVPGAVVALAILWPMAAVDQAVTRALDLATPVLTGTIVGVLYAYMLRFFAVAYGGIEASMQRITPNLDAAARTLGAGRLAVFRRVHVPLLGRAAMVAWMLVLIDVMKELPATLMLRPFNFDTLAVITLHLSQDERLAEAALPSLAIVAIGIIPVVLISRVMFRAPPEATAP